MKPSAALEGGSKVLAGGNGTTPYASVDGRHALGRVIETVESMKRASGQDSHPFDCMTYGAAVLLPNYERHVRRPPSRPERRTPRGPLASDAIARAAARAGREGPGVTGAALRLL